MNLLSSLLKYTADQIAALRAKDTSQDSTVSGINTRLTTAEGDIDSLEAQFTTVVSAVTTDTEVTNIRVGDDGVTYDTAGNAVREQFSDVKISATHENNYEAIKGQIFLNESNVHIGGIVNGAVNPNNLWRAYTDAIPVYAGCTITSSSDVTFLVFKSNDEGEIGTLIESSYVQTYTCPVGISHVILLIQVGSAEQITTANLIKIYGSFKKPVKIVPEVYGSMVEFGSNATLFLDGIVHVGGITGSDYNYTINTSNLWRAYTDPIKTFCGAVIKSNSASLSFSVFKYDIDTQKIIRILTGANNFVTEYEAQLDDEYIVLLIRNNPDALVDLDVIENAFTMTHFVDDITKRQIESIRNDIKSMSVKNNIVTASIINAASSSRPNQGERIVVASYNVAHFNNDTATYLPNEKIINFKKALIEMNADIVGIQEFRDKIDSDSAKSALSYLFAPMYYKQNGTIESAIFSKMDTGIGRMLTYSNGRWLTYTTVEINGKTLLLVSTHPIANQSGGADSEESIAARDTQYKELFQWVNGEITLDIYPDSGIPISAPEWEWCIIMADANSITNTDYTNLSNYAHNASFTLANGDIMGRLATAVSVGSWLSIDNIAVSSKVIINRVESYNSLFDALYSDHVPIMAEVTLT